MSRQPGMLHMLHPCPIAASPLKNASCSEKHHTMPVLPRLPLRRGRPRKTDMEKQISAHRSLKQKYKVCDHMCECVSFCMHTGNEEGYERGQEAKQADKRTMGLVQEPSAGDVSRTMSICMQT